MFYISVEFHLNRNFTRHLSSLVLALGKTNYQDGLVYTAHNCM